jgi:hypothetical protein
VRGLRVLVTQRLHDAQRLFARIHGLHAGDEAAFLDRQLAVAGRAQGEGHLD